MGESVMRYGAGFRVGGNPMLPRPHQRPRPAPWIGGNSRRAICRAVDSADEWALFPIPAKLSGLTRTAPFESAADLALAIDYAWAHAEPVGRTAPLTVCLIPHGLPMDGRPVDGHRVVASIVELAAIGVDSASVAFRGESRCEQLAVTDRFGANVLAAVSGN